MKIMEHTSIRELKSKIDLYDDDLEILILEREDEKNFSSLFECTSDALFSLAERLNIKDSASLTRDNLIAEIIKHLNVK